MAAYVITDLEVFDIEPYLAYQQAVKPLLEAAGARYLARGGEFRVADVGSGSQAGVGGRQPAGRCTLHAGTSKPSDSYVQVSGRPPRSGGRFLTARS